RRRERAGAAASAKLQPDGRVSQPVQIGRRQVHAVFRRDHVDGQLVDAPHSFVGDEHRPSGSHTSEGQVQCFHGGSRDGSGRLVEKCSGHIIYTEGPTADEAGNVYIVEQDNNRIMKYDTAGVLTTFMQPSGYANGMTFDNQGHLIACADEKNEMWSIDVATKK